MINFFRQSQQLCGLRRGSSLLEYRDHEFESHSRRACFCFSVCCVLCCPIQSKESYKMWIRISKIWQKGQISDRVITPVYTESYATIRTKRMKEVAFRWYLRLGSTYIFVNSSFSKTRLVLSELQFRSIAQICASFLLSRQCSVLYFVVVQYDIHR
jgi:hypothetical protein